MDTLRAQNALDDARRIFGSSTSTASELWAAAQSVIQSVLARPDLSGQTLISEARARGKVGLNDAYALVALLSWAEESADAVRDTSHERVLGEAMSALHRCVPTEHRNGPPAGTPVFVSATTSEVSNAGPVVSVTAPATSPATAPATAAALVPTQTSDGSRTLAVATVIGLTLMTIAALGGWLLLRSSRGGDFNAAVELYQSGAPESAESLFESVRETRPDDERPLIFLGRIARDKGEMEKSRTLLTNAVEIAPSNSLAARELASTLLASHQPDLARRFFVRAIELDPSDKLAQGFLGCALMQLGRTDEAARWLERAGSGEWEVCARNVNSETQKHQPKEQQFRSSSSLGRP